MLPQSVKFHGLKYKILELKDFEKNYKTFKHILDIFLFSDNNSVINYIYLTHLNLQSMKLFNHYVKFNFQTMRAKCLGVVLEVA